MRRSEDTAMHARRPNSDGSNYLVAYAVGAVAGTAIVLAVAIL